MKKKEEREPVSSGYCLMHNYIKETKKKREKTWFRENRYLDKRVAIT